MVILDKPKKFRTSMAETQRDEVKKIATEYYERGEIDSIIYNAVMNYKVE